MGQIFFRQQKYSEALVQFRMASEINPQSSVLHCYMAMTQHKAKKFSSALDMLHKALNLDPRNPLARYERAEVLISMEKYPDALAELGILKVGFRGRVWVPGRAGGAGDPEGPGFAGFQGAGFQGAGFGCRLDCCCLCV